MLAFGRAWFNAEGVSQRDVEEAFRGWELLLVEPAPTEGLGWPLNRTRPAWYRLRLSAQLPYARGFAACNSIVRPSGSTRLRRIEPRGRN